MKKANWNKTNLEKLYRDSVSSSFSSPEVRSIDHLFRPHNCNCVMIKGHRKIIHFLKITETNSWNYILIYHFGFEKYSQ
jgi:hypothetical protein